MLYHSFSTDYEPKVTGVRDGMSQVEIQPEGYVDKARFQELDSFFDLSTYWQRQDPTPPHAFIIEYVRMRPKAKLTDFLGYRPFFISCPFMLSGRAKEVFAQHYIQPSFLFEAFIYDKTGLVSRNYSLFNLPLLGHDVIDFSKSRFRVNLAQPWKPEWQYHTFSDLEDYRAFYKTNREFPSVESLVMNEKFDTKLDLFQCQIGPMFMSERLKKAVEKAGLSNIVFPSKIGCFAFAE